MFDLFGEGGKKSITVRDGGWKQDMWESARVRGLMERGESTRRAIEKRGKRELEMAKKRNDVRQTKWWEKEGKRKWRRFE